MDWEDIRGEISWDDYPIEMDRNLLDLGYGYYAYPVYPLDLGKIGYKLIETANCFVAEKGEILFYVEKELLGYLLIYRNSGKPLLAYSKALCLPGIKLKLKEILGI